MVGMSWVTHFRLGYSLFVKGWSVGFPDVTGRGICSAEPWGFGKELEQKVTEGCPREAAIKRCALQLSSGEQEGDRYQNDS